MSAFAFEARLYEEQGSRVVAYGNQRRRLIRPLIKALNKAKARRCEILQTHNRRVVFSLTRDKPVTV